MFTSEREPREGGRSEVWVRRRAGWWRSMAALVVLVLSREEVVGKVWFWWAAVVVENGEVMNWSMGEVTGLWSDGGRLYW